MGQGRLELPTSRLSGVRSNHLSYWPSFAHWLRLFSGQSSGGPIEGQVPRSLETESYGSPTVGLDLVVSGLLLDRGPLSRETP